MKMLTSFRGRLILTLIVLAVLPLGATTVLINIQAVSTLEMLSIEALQQSGQLVSAETRAFIEARQNELELLSSLTGLARLDVGQQRTCT